MKTIPFFLLSICVMLPTLAQTSNSNSHSNKGIHYSGAVDEAANADEDCVDNRPWYCQEQHHWLKEEPVDPTPELEYDTAWPARRPDFTDFR